MIGAPEKPLSEKGRCACGCMPRKSWEDDVCFSCGATVEGIRRSFERQLTEIMTLEEATHGLHA